MAILKHCVNILVLLAIIMVSGYLISYLLLNEFDPLILTFENESGQTISFIGIDAACHIETINSLNNGESTSVDLDLKSETVLRIFYFDPDGNQQGRVIPVFLSPGCSGTIKVTFTNSNDVLYSSEIRTSRHTDVVLRKSGTAEKIELL